MGEAMEKQMRGVRLKCCFTSTETVGLLGTGAQDVHLDFHTAPEFWNAWDTKDKVNTRIDIWTVGVQSHRDLAKGTKWHTYN